MGCKKGIDKPCSSNVVEFGSPIESNISELAGFSLEDREKLTAILESMKSLETQVQRLNKKLDTNTKELGKLKDENIKLKQALSLAVYNVDALEQYGRRENICIHGVAEKLNSNKDDEEEVVANIAAELGIDINECDIQRAHRLGKKKNSPGGKPRQIIARFFSYKKRNELLHAKKNLKGSKNYPKAFLTEDLTPLRSKLLNYVKYECNDKFVLCYSMNGRIRMKKASGRIDKEGKDNGVGDWISVASPDDLFKHGVNDFDFGKLNYYPLLFNDENDSDEE